MSIEIELTHAVVLFSDRGDGDLGRTARSPGDEPLANRERLLGRIAARCVVVPRQVHGSTVVAVEGGEGYRVGYPTADGLATTSRGVAVAVHVADCLPIAVAGEGGVAMLHAGWRGLAAGVIADGVATLRSLGVEGSLEAAIGPGVGGCCYEAGPEVHAELAAYCASHDRRLDLPAIAAAQLGDAGVATTTTVGPCTLCAPAGLLFSHRRDGPQTGRQAGLVWLR